MYKVPVRQAGMQQYEEKPWVLNRRRREGKNGHKKSKFSGGQNVFISIFVYCCWSCSVFSTHTLGRVFYYKVPFNTTRRRDEMGWDVTRQDTTHHHSFIFLASCTTHLLWTNACELRNSWPSRPVQLDLIHMFLIDQLHSADPTSIDRSTIIRNLFASIFQQAG